MKIFSYVAIAAISVAMAISQAGEPALDAPQADQGKPSLFTSESRNITAVVEAIDHETRLVTVGDIVVITQTSSLAISMEELEPE